jgi:hypothetical protein
MRQTNTEEDNQDNTREHAMELSLKLGDMQTMQLLSADDGPCWMSLAQWIATKKEQAYIKMK